MHNSVPDRVLRRLGTGRLPSLRQPVPLEYPTPEATARLLNAVCENRNYSLLDSPEDIVWDATWPCSGKIPGLYFWHIAKEVGAANRMEARTLLQDDAVFARFKSKYDHLLVGLSELPRDTVFVWSNI